MPFCTSCACATTPCTPSSNMCQYCASCIKIIAESCAPWLSAVHPWLIDVHQAFIWVNAVHQASVIAHCCTSGIHMAVLLASIRYGSMLCIHGAMMCIRNQYGSMLCIWHQYGSIWLSAVHQASLWHNYYGSMLCRHQFIAQRCSSGITKIIHNTAQSCASCISKAIDVVHPWLKLCIMHNMAQYSMNHCTKLITSYFVHFFFCYIFCLQLTLEKKKERRGTNLRFGWLQLCYLSTVGGLFWQSF